MHPRPNKKRGVSFASPEFLSWLILRAQVCKPLLACDCFVTLALWSLFVRLVSRFSDFLNLYSDSLLVSPDTKRTETKNGNEGSDLSFSV